MRKKGLFLVLLMIFMLTCLVSCNLFKNQARLANPHSQNDINVAEQPSSGYVNSLIMKIQDAYELTFTNNFTRAQVKVTDAVLNNPASVRIFDKNGKLVVGEYTTMVEPEVDTVKGGNGGLAETLEPTESGTAETELVEPNLADTDSVEPDSNESDTPPPLPVQYKLSSEPKSYTVELEIGSMIEISSLDTVVISSLSGTVAQNFMPSAEVETYAVMLSGLRKSTWDVKQGNAAMYGLVRDYFASALRQYEAELPNEILNNKNLDTKDKSQALIAYYQLTADDQAEFRDFIENIKRGGSPQISYTGRTEYTVGEKVNFASLVTATDPEDGEIEKITIQTDADLTKSGNYLLSILATDSDKNTSTMDVNIAVVNNYSDNSADRNQDSDGKGEMQDFGTGVSSLYPNSITTIIGGLVAEQEALRNTVAEQPAEENEPPVETPKEETPNISNPPVKNLTTEAANTTNTEEKTEESTGLKVWQIVLGAVAIIIVVGLIRFISDHYVR